MVVAVSAPPSSVRSVGDRYLEGLEELVGYFADRGAWASAGVSRAEAKFMLALARYRFAPPEGKLLTDRPQVMVFGGAGAGKSTVVNILAGATVAEVNPQAGFTRHPVAFFTETLPSIAGYLPTNLGPLRRRDVSGSSRDDQDVFGWKLLSNSESAGTFLDRHLIWDCPDLTTKDAEYYQSRVIEIAGLAEVGVYVASDERYNDELPTNFLQAMLEGGKSVIVVLTKVSEDDADELVKLFRDSVISRLRHAENIRAVVAIPSPPMGQMQDLWTNRFPYSAKLREAVEQITADLPAMRQREKQNACRYLSDRQMKLIEPLRRDLAEWRTWSSAVHEKGNEAVHRYEHEYLGKVDHAQFVEAVASLKNLFALTGPGTSYWMVMELLRAPYRFLKTLGKQWSPAIALPIYDDDRALDAIRRELMESLSLEAASRRHRHPFWRELHESLQTEARTLVEPVYQRLRQEQRKELETKLGTIRRGIPADFEGNPAMLWTIRGARTIFDLAAVWLALTLSWNYLGGLSIWTVVMGLLFLGLTEDLVDAVCKFYVRHHREDILKEQHQQVRKAIQSAYVDTMTFLPTGTGQRNAALAELVDRLPRDLEVLASASVREVT